MAITLGHNQYGKAETRVVRIFRDTEPHEIADYNVSVALVGDFTDVHLTGDNRKCLTTDATKNTVNAFAKEAGDAVREPESFGVAGSQQLLSPGVSGGDSGLLPPRPLCLGAPAPGSLADARVGLERPTDLAPVEVACDVLGGVEDGVEVGVRAVRKHLLDPAR